MTSSALPSCMMIVPCYNEGTRLQSSKFIEFADSHDGIQFLFVNDGSRDNTISVLEGLRAGREDRIYVLDLKQNMGKAEAVRHGILSAMQQSDATYVGFWDADLATPLDAIPEFMALLTNKASLQMVFGSRVRLLGREVKRKAIRHYLGRVFASVVSISLRLPIYDTQCGAKLFRASPELAEILRGPFLSRWVFDVEILARYIALYHGKTWYLRQSIYELPLTRWDDVAGSKVKAGDFFKAFWDVLLIYRRYILPSQSKQA